MTHNERITVALSVVAIIISIVSPLISYLWLQSSFREQELKSQALLTAGSYGILHSDEAPDTTQTTYRVHLKHVGKLPVSSVRISFEHDGGAFANLADDRIELYPPVRRTIQRAATTLVVALDDPVAPGGDIWLLLPLQTGEHDSDKFKGHPYDWVSSEASAPRQIAWQFPGGAAW